MRKSFVGALLAIQAGLARSPGSRGATRDLTSRTLGSGLGYHTLMVMPGEYCRERAARGARLSSGRGCGPPSRGQGEPGEGGEEGKVPRPPPHLARRGHGLALAPRPPRRGLPARPLRPAAAAGGESTQALTLSLGNGCRKVPAAAISPSSRGVPGALLRPPTAPGEFWGRRRSARGAPAPDHLPPPTQRARPHLRQPVHVARACGETRGSGAGAELRDGVPQDLSFPRLARGRWRAQAGVAPRGHPRARGQGSLSRPSRGVEVGALVGLGAGDQGPSQPPAPAPGVTVPADGAARWRPATHPGIRSRGAAPSRS